MEKANALSDSLIPQAAEYDSLDSDIARAQAESLKEALASGEMPLDDDVEGFAAQRIARDNITDHLRRVQSSIPVLENELQQAQDAVKNLDFERERAAEKVCAEAEAMATKYIAQLTTLVAQVIF